MRKIYAHSPSIRIQRVKTESPLLRVTGQNTLDVYELDNKTQEQAESEFEDFDDEPTSTAKPRKSVWDADDNALKSMWDQFT